MYVTHESCNCVLNFMLGQSDKVKSSPSKTVMFHHHMMKLGERGAGGCLPGLKPNINTHWEVKDDVPWWLVMFVQVCAFYLHEWYA